MKPIFALALLIVAIPLSGCLFPKLPAVPTTGGWVYSNVDVTTMWGSIHVGMIKSVVNQETNLPVIYLLKNPDGTTTRVQP